MHPLQPRSGDHGVIAFLHAGQTGNVQGNTLAACEGGVVYNGDTSGFSFEANTILNGSALDGVVVSVPLVTSAPGTNAGTLLVSASCTTPGATLRYTIDGSRVTDASPVWPIEELTVGVRAVAVLVKGFKNGMVESAVAGGIFVSESGA